MWYVPQHKRSFLRKHALDFGMAIGFLAFFSLPLLVWMLGLA